MKPVVLTILDGWGYSRETLGNAVLGAATPNIDEIEKSYPSLLLQASGLAVGMAWGEAGNSEVGHLTLGAGRTIPQYLLRINKEIESGYFFQNRELAKAIDHAKLNKSKIHIIGLLGSGSVHSHFNHLLSLLEMMKRNGVSDYFLHLFTDGKDSPLYGSPSLIKKMEEYFPGNINRIATIVGRNYAMDRNNQWELTQKTYQLWTEGGGEKVQQDVFLAIQHYHEGGFNDSNIPPTTINSDGTIKDGDALIFFNFREDSMRQIIRVFIDEYFNYFERKQKKNLFIVAFTPYVESINLRVAYPAPYVVNGLSEYLSINGKTQLHIAETEKYAHVTYFFNCLRSKPFDGETDLFMESVPNPLDIPQMRASEISSKVIEELDREYYDFMIVNFANPDVLAHFGDLNKVIQGIESVDREVGRIKDAVLEKNGALIISSDHGNAERMVYKSSGDPETRHDQNPVPFYLVAEGLKKQYSQEEIDVLRREPVGLLSDVAPTVLDLMGLKIPAEMTGESLLKTLNPKQDFYTL